VPDGQARRAPSEAQRSISWNARAVALPKMSGALNGTTPCRRARGAGERAAERGLGDVERSAGAGGHARPRVT
jgi:hypothetical protein